MIIMYKYYSLYIMKDGDEKRMIVIKRRDEKGGSEFLRE